MHLGGPPVVLSCLTLLQAGLAWPTRSPGSPVVSYSTLAPLPVIPWGSIGGLLSVALSSESPRLGVTQRLALWSPDFPRCREAPRLPGRLIAIQE